MRIILAVVFLVVLANAAFAAEGPSKSQVAKAPDCNDQVAKIFAGMISIQSGQTLKAQDVNIGHLTKYEWTISATLADGKYVEYLADVDMEDNCNILSMIEASDEQPSYDRHWKKQD